MTRFLPFPLASAGLLILWLLLNETVAPGHIVLGGVIALIAGWTLRALGLPRVHLRRPGIIVRLAAMVIADIVRSNIAVARIVLGLGSAERRSGLVEIPLELCNPYALAALACIITATPGTLWVGFDAPTGRLMIHVLDLVDPAEWVRTIKGRYEGPLLEIFG